MNNEDRADAGSPKAGACCVVLKYIYEVLDKHFPVRNDQQAGVLYSFLVGRLLAKYPDLAENVTLENLTIPNLGGMTFCLSRLCTGALTNIRTVIGDGQHRSMSLLLACFPYKIEERRNYTDRITEFVVVDDTKGAEKKFNVVAGNLVKHLSVDLCFTSDDSDMAASFETACMNKSRDVQVKETQHRGLTLADW